MSQPVKIDQIHSIGITDWNHPMVPKEFDHIPRPLRDDDIDIRVIACGICGSDIHMVKGNWGQPYCPVAVGHEIVGYVVNKGKNVTNVDIGDRVGVGAQSRCCHSCYACSVHKENNCDDMEGTYGTPFGDGRGTQGGYSKYVRVASDLSFKIPEKLESKHVAPMLCGGITGFKPLLTGGVTKGTKVGIVGVGGIGHMTILFAKALGAEVTAISRSDSKKEVAKKLGADHFIATNASSFPEDYKTTLDVIVNTASTFSGENLVDIMSLLRPDGKFIYITAPPVGEMITFPPQVLMKKNLSISASAIGSINDIKYMLDFAAEHDIKPWVETSDINVSNVDTCWKRMDKGDVRFRFVLTGYEKFFGE